MTTDKAESRVTILVVSSGEQEGVGISQQLGRAMVAKILVARTAEGLIEFARKHAPTIVLFGPSMVHYEGAYLPDMIKRLSPQAQVVVLEESN
jgi:hypothetical protein